MSRKEQKDRGLSALLARQKKLQSPTYRLRETIIPFA